MGSGSGYGFRSNTSKRIRPGTDIFRIVTVGDRLIITWWNKLQHEVLDRDLNNRCTNHAFVERSIRT